MGIPCDETLTAVIALGKEEGRRLRRAQRSRPTVRGQHGTAYPCPPSEASCEAGGVRSRPAGGIDRREAWKYAILSAVAKWLQNGKERTMASLTIRDLPDRTLASLKTRADMNRRSLNGEMLYILDYVVSGRSEFDMIRENRIAKQKEAFRAVFGKWRDSRSTD